MEFLEAIRVAIKELVVPELDKIREENREIKGLLSITNKRLDDVNIHLADQSRRIDDTNRRIDEVREQLTHRIDETNKRIDAVREELTGRIDETNKRIDAVREELSHSMSASNQRLDTLYEVVVRRDDHFQLANRVAAVERELAELKQKIAA